MLRLLTIPLIPFLLSFGPADLDRPIVLGHSPASGPALSASSSMAASRSTSASPSMSASRSTAPRSRTASSSWSWPIRAPHLIVRPYLAPETRYSAGHRGIDIAAPGLAPAPAAPGGTVTAPADGVVHFVGTVVDRPVLSIDHGGGVLSSFEPVESDLHKGDRVSRGQVLGVVSYGHCSAPCLHLGVRVNGLYVSPLLFLGEIPRAVLLPMRRG